ncbi:4-amino-4-deoxy-L-arabinose transferase or related glycosyltransferase of PMT family [Pseudomonas syringae pv. actinidiae]|uniref:4-amino-4-deoxy-L-arabinose transferase or related glycosyltransferase of PMT family n=1 Tax=Pseudomonas syringae pv. actinidiae TaxID=103796 RepID=A0A2V0QGD2_PSESF|nr:4-amino-4-deoxy-L-arabinose transferase or related glycosyltransferase of PMT family [Pseudomonas syringae pv. actinidiae]
MNTWYGGASFKAFISNSVYQCLIYFIPIVLVFLEAEPV